MIFVGIFIYLLFWIMTINAQYRKSYFATTIIVFVILELYIYSLPLMRVYRHDTFKEAPYVSYLKEDDEDTFRVYGQNAPGHNSMLFPNVSSVFEIQDIRFLLALGEKRYFEFLENVVGASEFEMATIRFTGESNLLFNERFFDLMNVKYFLTLVNQNNDIPENILKDGKILLNEQNINFVQTNLNNKLLSGVFLHAPAKIEFPFHVEDDHLLFEYGIANSGVDGSNGVNFIISIISENEKKEIFNKLINPLENANYRSWQKINIDLSNYKDRDIKFIFETQDNGNASYDHFCVGNFSSKDNPLIFDEGIEITKNEDYLPRAFVVHKAQEMFEKEMIWEKLKDPNFDIRNEIIIEKDLPDKLLTSSAASDQSKVEIMNYQDQLVEIVAEMENPGFLVLLDQYYPGWKAYVNGKETEIYPTDYVFRSIYLPKGFHKVEFRYEPQSYRTGKYITFVTLFFLLLLYLGRNKIDRFLSKEC